VLHVAAAGTKQTAIKTLLAHTRTSDINRVNQNGHTPLDIAVKANHTGIAQLLRAHGATQGGTPAAHESNGPPAGDGSA